MFPVLPAAPSCLCILPDPAARPAAQKSAPGVAPASPFVPGVRQRPSATVDLRLLQLVGPVRLPASVRHPACPQGHVKKVHAQFASFTPPAVCLQLRLRKMEIGLRPRKNQ